MTRSALWQQLATYPAQLDRQLLATLWPIPGRLTGMAVTVSTGRVVNIAPGAFVVPLAAGAGSALAISDAIETATFPAAPASGSNRIDNLIVQIHDVALDAGSSNGFTFDVTVGAVAASPVAPAVPARALVLAQVYSHGAQANLAQVDITPSAPATAPPWALPADTGHIVPAPLTNGWVLGTNGCSYRLTGNVVRFYGSLQNGTNGSPAFTLPVGMRPPQTANYTALNPVSLPGASGGWTVTPAGIVTPTGNAGYGVYCDGITFTVD